MNKILIGLLAVIIIGGMLLRFFNIEAVFPYGWDQVRDAYQVKDILNGNIALEGPRTGVGHFHLGPLWFYLLVPFYYFTHLDPIASQYLNILICLTTFGIIFYVTKKLFTIPLALLILYMYATNAYLVGINRIPWNVSLMPCLAFLTFYLFFKTFQKKTFTYAALLMTCCGISFHAHFSAIVFPMMIGLLWLMDRNKKLLITLIKAVPFYVVWFIPTILSSFLTNYSDYHLINNFLHDYIVGFHLQFLLHQLPQTFILFRLVLLAPFILALFLVTILLLGYFSADKKEKLYCKIIFSMLISFVIIFGIYGGQVSEYYFLFTLPAIYYTFLMLLTWALRFRVVTYILLALYLSFYTYQNVSSYRMPLYGLDDQRKSVENQMKSKEKFIIKDDEIESYLYLLYKK